MKLGGHGLGGAWRVLAFSLVPANAAQRVLPAVACIFHPGAGENDEEAFAFLRQGLGAAGDNTALMEFDFDGSVAHAVRVVGIVRRTSVVLA